jgi:hypothetical protein
VHTIQTALPRRELTEFVRVFAQRDVSCTGEGFRQFDIASLEHILSFDFGDLSTIHYTNCQSKFVPRIHVVGSQTADYQPLSLSTLATPYYFPEIDARPRLHL